MKTFTILKEIKAESIQEALKNEHKGKVLQVLDDQDEADDMPQIGFRC